MWSGIDRRRFPRVEFPCKVIIHKKQGIEKHLIHTDNVSVGGICAILEKDLGLFSCVDLEINLSEEGSSDIIKVPAKIVWIVKRTSEGKSAHHFDTGFEFNGLKKEDQKKIEKAIKKVH